MHYLDLDYTQELYNSRKQPCLSLYQPTHRNYPDNQQDPIRFRNLVKVLEKSLTRKYQSKKVKKILNPFRKLAEDVDFWKQSGDGLVVLGASDFFQVYRLQRPVEELAVVAGSFHLKPLLRILQSADRYHVLGVNGKKVTLFEGNRYGISAVPLSEEVRIAIDSAREVSRKEMHVEVSTTAPRSSGSRMRGGLGAEESEDHDSDRYFRAVDRAILKHYTRPSGLPLILVSLPEGNNGFRRVSRNPLLVKNGITTNPESLSIDEMRDRAWQAFEPCYLERLAGMVEMFNSAQSKGLGNYDLEQVTKAAVAGRVATLLIEADRQIPGRCDETSGIIEFDELENPDVDDLLDDLGEKVVKTGGQVVVIPKDKMPTDSGLAAIYRF